jgi:Fe-S cluster biogenesis protein NfuA
MVNISAQITPNPNTLKFVVDQILLDYGSIDFSNVEKAESSPLVKALFAQNGVVGVLVGTNFISVTKSNTVDWTELAEPIIDVLHKDIDAGGTLVDTSLLDGPATSGPDSEIESKIRTILDNEIRPAVAMDGGDIIFHSYKEGVVMLHLQGACSTCPSSTLTLKMGIENRLREEIPEIVDVIQI